MKKITLVIIGMIFIGAGFVGVLALNNSLNDSEEEIVETEDLEISITRTYNYDKIEDPKTLQDYQYNLVKEWWEERDKYTDPEIRQEIKEYYSYELKQLRENYDFYQANINSQNG